MFGSEFQEKKARNEPTEIAGKFFVRCLLSEIKLYLGTFYKLNSPVYPRLTTGPDRSRFRGKYRDVFGIFY